MDADKAWEYQNRLSDLIYELQAEKNRVSAGNPPHGIDDRIDDLWWCTVRAWADLERTLKPGE